MSNQVEDRFKFLWPFQNVRTLVENSALIKFYEHEHLFFYLSWEEKTWKYVQYYSFALLWGRLHSRKSYKNDISLCSVLKAFYYYFWKSSLKKSLIKINKIKFYGHEHFLFIVTRKNRIYYFITINMTFQAGWRHFISFFFQFSYLGLTSFWETAGKTGVPS